MPDAPIQTLLYFHTALANDLEEICRALEGERLKEPVAERIDTLHGMAELHTHVEENGLFPYIAGKVNIDTATLEEEHRIEEELFEALLASLVEGGGRSAAAARALQRHLMAHIAKENSTLFPAMEKALSVQQQLEAVQAVQAAVPRDKAGVLLPWVVRHQPLDRAVVYVRGMQDKMPPPAFDGVCRMLKDGLPAVRWSQLSDLVPGM